MFEDERLREMYQTGLEQEKYGAELARQQKEKDRTETQIRTAESYIQQAKNILSEYYDEYADIQEWMNEMEAVRMMTETLLSRFLNGEMK